MEQVHSCVFLFFLTLRVQKHKERDRHKPKHKKATMDMSPSLVLPNIMVPDKVRPSAVCCLIVTIELNARAGLACYFYFFILL